MREIQYIEAGDKRLALCLDDGEYFLAIDSPHEHETIELAEGITYTDAVICLYNKANELVK